MSEKQIQVSQPSEWYLMGMIMAKIQFWSFRYELSFQFWGEGNNNVFINRGDVEIASFGGRDTPMQLFKEVIKWCEKANPRIKYPKGIEITNQQP